MDAGYKHFSHAHNLIMHQVHEAAKMSCSCCNSLVIGTIFVCSPCNFTLHEQCFRATRSLKHPSHPSHPLTLVPYPTYPSNSFYCNSCKITGTGLSYSCSDCEFDLHVHCALSISGAANSHQPSIINPVNYHSLPNQTHGQEMVSQGGWNSHLAQNVYAPTSSQNQNTGVQHSYMHAQHVGFASAQTSTQNSITNPQYSSTAPNMRVEEGASITDSDLEHIKMNRLRLEIAREEYRIASISNQNILDSI